MIKKILKTGLFTLIFTMICILSMSTYAKAGENYKSLGEFEKLTKDITITSDIVLMDSDVDLNGYKLTINGNLIQVEGKMNINKGKLVVNGDYRIQDINLDLDENYYPYKNMTDDDFGTTSYAYLYMINKEDTVIVNGNYTDSSGESFLRAGTMYFKGDFSAGDAKFKPSATHKVVFNGDKDQSIRLAFDLRSTENLFNILSVEKKSGKIICDGIVPFYTIDKDTTIPVAADSYFLMNSYYSNIKLNGHKLVIDGNLIHLAGKLYVDGGELIVNGDYRITEDKTDFIQNKTPYSVLEYDVDFGNASYAELIMNKAKDKVLVKGSFYHYSQENGEFKDGVMEVKGDFITDNYGMIACENHKVILSGEEPQKIDLRCDSAEDSTLNILEIKNPKIQGEVGKNYKYNKLIGVDINNNPIIVFDARGVYPIAFDRSLNDYKIEVKKNGKDVKFNSYKIEDGKIIVLCIFEKEQEGVYEVTVNEGDFNKTTTLSIVDKDKLIKELRHENSILSNTKN